MVIFYHYIGSTVVLHPAKFRGVVNAAEVRGRRRHAWMYLESMGAPHKLHLLQCGSRSLALAQLEGKQGLC